MELKSLSISFPHFASEESEAESLGQYSWVQEGKGAEKSAFLGHCKSFISQVYE